MEAKLWTGKCTEWMSESREVGAEEDEEKPGREGGREMEAGAR